MGEHSGDSVIVTVPHRSVSLLRALGMALLTVTAPHAAAKDAAARLLRDVPDAPASVALLAKALAEGAMDTKFKYNAALVLLRADRLTFAEYTTLYRLALDFVDAHFNLCGRYPLGVVVQVPGTHAGDAAPAWVPADGQYTSHVMALILESLICEVKAHGKAALPLVHATLSCFPNDGHSAEAGIVHGLHFRGVAASCRAYTGSTVTRLDGLLADFLKRYAPADSVAALPPSPVAGPIVIGCLLLRQLLWDC
jgi:hypothetical protein